jgi:hypothetical protein
MVLQVSAGHLNDAEEGEGSLPPADVDRVTASLTYHRRVGSGNLWASTMAWGRNEERSLASHAFLAESSVAFAERDVWFGRVEVGTKPAHDLHAHEFTGVMTVAKVQGGYTRYLASASGLRLGVGGLASLGFVAEALKPHYGRRANPGVGVFVTVRPAAMIHVGAG